MEVGRWREEEGGGRERVEEGEGGGKERVEVGRGWR